MTREKTIKTLRGAARGNIAARLREIREHLRFSQKEMGGQFGMKENTYGKTETGYTAPSLKLLYMLATGLKISLDWLICGRGTMFYGTPEEKETVEKAEKDELSKEIDEMSELIEKLPLARHLILGYFQKFKVDYNDVIQKELEKKEEDTRKKNNGA